jgi:hypothetical protein
MKIVYLTKKTEEIQVVKELANLSGFFRALLVRAG